MKPIQVVAALAGFTSLTSAWSGAGVLDGRTERIVRGIEQLEGLWRRQEASTTSSSTTTTRGKASSTNTASAAASATGTSGSTATGTNTGTAESKVTGTAARTGSIASGNSTQTTYSAQLPAGGISMMTPNPRSSSSYYKIGDWVTFAWNFTSVAAKPSAVNVLASCSANNQQYTIAANMSYEPTMKVLWDTSKYSGDTDQYQLLTNKYTLIVENADEQIATAVVKPGYFQSAANVYFGMYSPQPYTPWAEFTCPTCSAAMSQNERQTWCFLLGMFSVTILSFTYFATGRFGVL